MGTAGSIGAYLLLTRGRWQASSLRYAVLNGVAGLLGASASAVYGAWPSAVSNLLWTCISVQSAAVTLRERRSQRLAVVTRLPVVDPDPEPPTGPQQLVLRAA
jgi:hypothetical protein